MSKQLLMLGSMTGDKDEDELEPEYDISEDEEDEKNGDNSEDKGTPSSSHSKLMKAISSLDSKKKSKIKQRSEPTTEVSEFHLNKATDERGVKVHELVKTLKNTASNSDIRKQLNNFQKKTPTLKTPLYKHEADKIQRTVAYNATSKEISKWDEIVKNNRKAETRSFPLFQQKVTLQNTNALVKKFTHTTKLEQEIYRLVKGSKSAEQKGKDLSQAEEDALKAMSLQEAQERRAELQKYRALQSYYEAKCRRQKKIKSRKFHRIQRKAKAKDESKKLAVMLENNPEEAQELLMKMEKARAQERMSLKHKNTGKWAKGQIKFGKYNRDARDLLQDQLQKSRDLTQKIASANLSDDDKATKNTSDSDDEDEDGADNPSLMDINNPWFESTSKSAKITEIESEHQYSTDLFPTLEPVVAPKNDSASDSDDESDDDDGEEIGSSGLKKSEIDELINEKMKGRTNDNDDEEDDFEEFDEEIIAETLERRQTLEKLNENWDNEDTIGKSTNSTNSKQAQTVIQEDDKKNGDDNKKAKKTKEHIDINKVFQIQPKELNSLAPDLFQDEEKNEEQEQRMNIQQAFADDDVVDEFQEEKAKVVEEDKPKDIDLTLPGWGDWGGVGAKKESKKKKKKFIIKAAPAKPRKDKLLGHVIINEKRDAKIAMHQVHDLPQTFNNPSQFERSIRAPVGPHWNTALTVKKLTAPKVRTRMGKVIDPISADDVFEKDTKVKKDWKSGDGKRGGKHKPDIMLDDDGPPRKRGRNKAKGKQNGNRNSKKSK